MYKNHCNQYWQTQASGPLDFDRKTRPCIFEALGQSQILNNQDTHVIHLCAENEDGKSEEKKQSTKSWTILKENIGKIMFAFRSIYVNQVPLKYFPDYEIFWDVCVLWEVSYETWSIITESDQVTWENNLLGLEGWK